MCALGRLRNMKMRMIEGLSMVTVAFFANALVIGAMVLS